MMASSNSKTLSSSSRVKGYLKITTDNAISLKTIEQSFSKTPSYKKYFAGSVSFPKKTYVVPVRRSPCGRGSGTYDHFKRVQYKRLYLINSFEAIETIFPTLNKVTDVSYSINFNY